MSLPEVGIDDSRLREMAEHTVHATMRLDNAWVPLSADDVEAIYRASL